MKSGVCSVYIMTNRKRTVLYTGVTSDLPTRVAEHRARIQPGSFASRYNTDRLVYFETTPSIEAAIAREKQIKGWLRRKKIELIERVNPQWTDLAADWSL
jgi:predicted GIY-YIG superfamily endonuclease